MCILIPVLLLAVKYCVDIVSYNHAQIYTGGNNFYKKCANEAALAVAKKWNPGLTLNQQDKSLLRIADDIYNKNPCYCDAPVHRAIPGLEVGKVKGESRGTYNPLKLSWSDADRIVVYTTMSSTNKRALYINGGNYAFYRIMYGNPKDPKFLLKADSSGNWVSEDMFWDFVPDNGYTIYRAALYTCRFEHATVGLYSTIWDLESQESTTYTERTNSSDDTVQISVEDNKIKVQADDDIGYATPAECNVDIVLAIPVNGAACNNNNYDRNTPTAGTPVAVDFANRGEINSATISANSDVKNMRSTPIYQIAQAFKKFLRDNFEFTKGVNVGLIPYSGKLSVPPHRYAWTQAISTFVVDKFLGSQNDCPAYIRGCFLYGTPGLEESNLADSPTRVGSDFELDPVSNNAVSTTGYQWGRCYDNLENACPLTSIMCRGEYSAESTYGCNRMCVGDLLSTADPTDENMKFRRMNMYPCYLGYANFLTMTCEKRQNIRHTWTGNTAGCNYLSFYLALPYFLIELQADVGKICDLLNVIGPFVDDYNVSNFLFIPITWANNLFQEWTNDTKCEKVDTVGAPTGGQLSRPSKMTKNRQKALILVVNKPDWFEPNELTYLGFDNDFSEIPMIESDCIRFDIDYSDASRKFLDGSAYNGTIQGPRKILKYETVSGNVGRNADSGFYETTTGDETCTAKLSFPNKYLVKITVAPLDVGKNLSKW
ncbi:MAG: hypothetical protein LBB21_06570, partial [Holosporaceae bacterium]|nr:hypothetical protein [Holosporaceae bacterium]